MQTDILSGFVALRIAFQRQGLKVPVAIVLESAEEGMRFLSCMHDCGPSIRHYMDEDVVMTTVKVMGVEVRWPSQHYMMADGEVKYL